MAGWAFRPRRGQWRGALRGRGRLILAGSISWWRQSVFGAITPCRLQGRPLTAASTVSCTTARRDLSCVEATPCLRLSPVLAAVSPLHPSNAPCFASSGLPPAVRTRHFHHPATALPDTRCLGSLQKTANALGLSHPTTAQPNFLQTLPATSGVGGLTRYARGRCPQRLPPPP